MISKAFMTVLFTGFIAGIIVTGVQMLKVTPLILQAETYELDEVAIKHTHSESGIEHEHNLNGVTLENHIQVKDFHDDKTEASIDLDESWMPSDGMERSFFTMVSVSYKHLTLPTKA